MYVPNSLSNENVGIFPFLVGEWGWGVKYTLAEFRRTMWKCALSLIMCLVYLFRKDAYRSDFGCSVNKRIEDES